MHMNEKACLCMDARMHADGKKTKGKKQRTVVWCAILCPLWAGVPLYASNLPPHGLATGVVPTANPPMSCAQDHGGPTRGWGPRAPLMSVESGYTSPS